MIKPGIRVLFCFIVVFSCSEVAARNSADDIFHRIGSLPEKEQVKTLADLCWQYRNRLPVIKSVQNY